MHSASMSLYMIMMINDHGKKNAVWTKLKQITPGDMNTNDDMMACHHVGLLSISYGGLSYFF